MQYKTIKTVQDLKELLAFVPDHYSFTAQDENGANLFNGADIVIIPDHETKQIAILPASAAPVADE